jgi:hypothetical protein
LAETPRAEIANLMALASPKKEELAREFKINSEVNAKLEDFMKAEPGLVKFVKELPREQLERKFLLRKMQDQQQKQGLRRQGQGLAGEARTGGTGQEPQGHRQPQHEARETSPGARQSGQELYPQHGYQN